MRPPQDGFPIAGIGASAGGLEAVTALLGALPDDPGVALVLIQHLDPDHESMLVTLLARATALPVHEAEEAMKVERNHVYVIPRNTTMVIRDGRLRLSERRPDGGRYLPVDRFFDSLAGDQRARAIAIVLSGTGSDGSQGVRAVKAAGGITFAQDVASAKFPGMPQSAVGTGTVDFVLPPAKIAQELAAVSRHEYLRAEAPDAVIDSAPGAADAWSQIFGLLRGSTGVDFADYKPATIKRRVSRRMAMRNLADLGAYAAYCAAHADEVAKLYDDLLINVTEFFRDEAVFTLLRDQLFPKLAAAAPAGSAIRVWVPGCSSAEEVYSMAIVLLEATAAARGDHVLQIFGSDISEGAINRARAGRYPVNIQQQVSRERLDRFFTKTDTGYQISGNIRELCVFAKHDVIADPPFSRMDFISCRNLLIYLGPSLQRRVQAVLHYALKPGGYLLLGHSESLGPLDPRFEAQDPKVKLYRKVWATNEAGSALPLPRPGRVARPFEDAPPRWSEAALRNAADQVVLRRYGPPGVLVDAHLQIVAFRGDTSAFLVAGPGAPSHDLFSMARRTIAQALRSALAEVRKSGKPVRREHLRVESGGRARTFDLEVLPVPNAHPHEPLWLVLFLNRAPVAPRGAPGRAGKPDDDQPSRAEMAADLLAARHSLESMVEAHEATNDDLQSAFEEVQSSNEELQSTNEELQTSKEEIQATNEELRTVNEEMQHQNAELTEANDDLLNLFASVNAPIVMLTNDMSIRRFTPAAARVMNLIAGDVGRPIGNINVGLEGPDLEAESRRVIETLEPFDDLVQDREGQWQMLQIRAYRTRDNRIEGAVVLLVNVDEIERSRDLLQGILDTMREGLVVLDRDNRVKLANQYFYRSFGLTTTPTEGHSIYDIAEGRLNLAAIRALVDGARLHNTRLQNVKITFEELGRSPRTMYLNARRLGGAPLVLLVFREPSDLL
ncbi:MAG: chemotaxis protein CheB [Gemmatimonadaceae bacterium]